jgi:hypothetical protein
MSYRHFETGLQGLKPLDSPTAMRASPRATCFRNHRALGFEAHLARLLPDVAFYPTVE